VKIRYALRIGKKGKKRLAAAINDGSRGEFGRNIESKKKVKPLTTEQLSNQQK